MNIGFLTSGGLAPCLSASIGALIESYKREKVTANFVGYLNGYKGLLQSKSYLFPSNNVVKACSSANSTPCL